MRKVINSRADGNSGYVALYKGNAVELWANTMWDAVQKARQHFKPPIKQLHLISVHPRPSILTDAWEPNMPDPTQKSYLLTIPIHRTTEKAIETIREQCPFSADAEIVSEAIGNLLANGKLRLVKNGKLMTICTPDEEDAP